MSELLKRIEEYSLEEIMGNVLVDIVRQLY